MNWKAILDFLNSASNVIVVIFLTASIILFTPETLLSILNLDQIPKGALQICGLIWILSGTKILIDLVFPVVSFSKELIKEWRYQKTVLAYLDHLSSSEKAFLYRYIKEDTKSINAGINDDAVVSLEPAKIIFRASQISHSFSFPFVIQPYVLRYLKKKPKLLDLVGESKPSA